MSPFALPPSPFALHPSPFALSHRLHFPRLQRLANVYRGSQLESFHTGSVVVVDARGRTLAVAGDPTFRTCLRSAAKPFQSIPLLEYGGAEEYDLTGEEIALTCGSHGGGPGPVGTGGASPREGGVAAEERFLRAQLA